MHYDPLTFLPSRFYDWFRLLRVCTLIFHWPHNYRCWANLQNWTRPFLIDQKSNFWGEGRTDLPAEVMVSYALARVAVTVITVGVGPITVPVLTVAVTQSGVYWAPVVLTISYHTLLIPHWGLGVGHMLQFLWDVKHVVQSVYYGNCGVSVTVLQLLQCYSVTAVTASHPALHNPMNPLLTTARDITVLPSCVCIISVTPRPRFGTLRVTAKVLC